MGGLRTPPSPGHVPTSSTATVSYLTASGLIVPPTLPGRSDTSSPPEHRLRRSAAAGITWHIVDVCASRSSCSMVFTSWTRSRPRGLPPRRQARD